MPVSQPFVRLHTRQEQRTLYLPDGKGLQVVAAADSDAERDWKAANCGQGGRSASVFVRYFQPKSQRTRRRSPTMKRSNSVWTFKAKATRRTKLERRTRMTRLARFVGDRQSFQFSRNSLNLRTGLEGATWEVSNILFLCSHYTLSFLLQKWAPKNPCLHDADHHQLAHGGDWNTWANSRYSVSSALRRVSLQFRRNTKSQML